MTRAALVASLLALSFASGSAAEAPPPCAQGCRKLAADGDLAVGVSEKDCTLRVCEEEARDLYGSGDYEAAIASLDYIRKDRAESPAYQMDRGLVLYALGRFEEALESFDVVVKAFPNGIRGGAQRAHTLARLGRTDDAIAQFRKLETVPGAERTFRDLRTGSYLAGNIGSIELRQGKLEQGKASLRRALEIDGKNQLAQTLLHKLVPALEAGTLDGDGLFELQVAFEDISLGRPQEAARHLETVVRTNPRFPVPYLLLAEGLRNQTRYAECEEVLREAEKNIPDDSDVRVQRIRCGLLRYGVASEKSKPLIAELKQIRANDPENQGARRMLEAIDER
jgi:tetratricopeptide (TPR) repeat protein